jgi:hypothetical protein
MQDLAKAMKKHEAADIVRISEESKNLKLSRKNKTQAMTPPVFHSRKFTFYAWANFVRTGTEVELFVGLLLTYLSPGDYNAVSRVYDMDKLADLEYAKAVDIISHIIIDKVNRCKAVSRLLKLKQGNLTMQEFIDNISEMAAIGFPGEHGRCYC